MCTSEYLDSTVGGTNPPADDGAWITVQTEPAARTGGGPSAAGTPGGAPPDQPHVILRTKLMPYPAGYNSDDDDDDEDDEEENLVNPDRNKDKVLDTGGYTRQQDTLIVWTDQNTGSEMALSFATSAGCAEIWNFIRKSRRWTADQPATSPSPSPSLSSPHAFPMYPSMSPRLPEPSLGNIELIEGAIRTLGRTAVGRERMASTILKGDYVKKLIRIHNEAEDLESLPDLHALCRVMQTILLLNDNGIFELILRDDVILGVASILEYDPEFPTMKASYRAHLADPSHFTQVVQIRSSALLAKIHQTHRLHYLKDVVLARVLEDSTFSMLNSAIYFNEVDIVNEVATDPVLLKELFALFDEDEAAAAKPKATPTNGALIGPQLPPALARSLGIPSPSPSLSSHPLSPAPAPTSPMDIDSPPMIGPQPLPSPSGSPPPTRPDRKHDAILFLQQLCSMAKNLQLPLRAAFFRSLADRGLLRVIEVALSRTVTREDPVMRAATVEILMTLVDHDPNNVRGYSLKQHAAGKRALAVFLIELFHKEEDLGLKAQMSEALRVLVDAGGDGGPLEAPPRMRQEDPKAEDFLQYFYDECMTPLLTPIRSLPALSPTDPPLSLPLADVALCGHLCDLLCFFVSHHTFRSKYHVLSTDLAQDVAKLYRTRHKHLQLAALRFFRACVGRADDFYNRFLVKNDLFRPVVEIAVAERDRDNLLSSACLEFFEFIRGTNVKAVINHLMDRHGERIRLLARTLKTFEMLIARWEQNNEPPPKVEAVSATATSKSMTREGGNWARMDIEEESYFNGSDEEDDSTNVSTGGSGSTTKQPAGSRKRDAEASDGDDRKRLRLDQAPSSLPRSKTWPEAASDTKGKGKGLVDYGDDDSDDDDDASSSSSAPIDSNPGGFVRAAEAPPILGTGDKPAQPFSSSSSSSSSTTNGATSTPEEPAPVVIDTGEGPPPIPPRRKEADDDDTLALLGGAAKRKAAVGGQAGAASGPKPASKFKVSFGVKNLASLTGVVADPPPKDPPKDAEEGKK
ncbi:hypothetical protein RQP46_004906 [Phenoliferia psychrophenolica]